MVALQGQPRSFLGINLTPSHVSLVELIDRGPRIDVATYALAEVPAAAQPALSTHEPEATAQLVQFLGQVLEQAAVSGDAAIFSLYSPHIFSTVMHLPNVADDELAAAIRFKARDLVPADLKDLVITATRPNEHKHHIPLTPPTQTEGVVLSPRSPASNISSPAGDQALCYLIHAIPLQTINWYGQLAQSLNLELIALEENVFPISRIHPTTNSHCTFFIHVDNDVVNFYAVSRQSVCLTRTLDTIANDSPDLSSLAAEAERTITQFHQTGCPEPTQVYLLGREPNLVALQKTLTGLLPYPVHLSQPFSGLSYPQGIEQGLSTQGPAFTVAIGLAERQINIV